MHPNQTTACGALSPHGVTCVLSRNHTGDHRGVEWTDDKPADHYWPQGRDYVGKRRRPVQTAPVTDFQGLVTDYSPRHRATETTSVQGMTR